MRALLLMMMLLQHATPAATRAADGRCRHAVILPLLLPFFADDEFQRAMLYDARCRFLLSAAPIHIAAPS